ncbi:PaaI family thioesterase [Parahaliea mediterranea]|uniref:PaaI family thioesterase n=1 Tax=Parahaliea mediterranea TaxID=651086 RepID=A0A939IN59_9GAMM|nr:PaaI family thioesterase [Parahaliea mediterranea]MBN7798225.1 PaaI family thioesterase [Parahaliea mediterranea]
MINYHERYGHLSGLERLKVFEEAGDARFGIAQNMGYDVLAIDEGSVVYRYTPQEAHVNLIGGIHGGVMSTLLDTAMGAAVMTTLAPGESHTIIDLAVKFLRPIRLDHDPVIVEGRLEHRGRRTATAEGWIRNGAGKLIAKGSATAIML